MGHSRTSGAAGRVVVPLAIAAVLLVFASLLGALVLRDLDVHGCYPAASSVE